MAVKEQVYGFYIPTVTLMGIGSHKEIGNQIKVLGGKKPFLCTDKGIVSAGIADEIIQLIKKDTGLDVVVFDETVPNPTDVNVHDGL
ncbi:MAG: alcohol dehydrogenase, partial [Desulfacinum sp.]|nr:alcohol dehydrogenase [Desulfacinum sp.]